MFEKVLAIARKELLFIMRSRQALFALLLLPLLYAGFIGFIYYEGKITGLPLAICDQDNSSLSRELVRDIQSSETFGKVYFAESFPEVEDLIEKGICKAAVVIPEDFSETVTKGGTSQVLAIADGSNIIYPNTALTSAGEAIKMFSAKTGLRMMLKEKILPDKAMDILTAVSFREQPLYNPAYSYSYFLAFGVMFALWQIMAVFGISASIAREWAQGTWINFMLSPLRKTEIIIGKTLPYYLLNFIQITLIYAFGVYVLRLPMRGSILLLLLTAVFLLVLMGLGFLCSLIGDTPLNATRYPMLIVLPSFILSGYTWPLEAMPGFIRNVAYCMPLTYMLHGLRSITMRGLGWDAIWHDFAVLLLMACLLYAAAFALLKKYESLPLRGALIYSIKAGRGAKQASLCKAEEV